MKRHHLNRMVAHPIRLATSSLRASLHGEYPVPFLVSQQLEAWLAQQTIIHYDLEQLEDWFAQQLTLHCTIHHP